MKQTRRSKLLAKTFVFIAAFALAGAPAAPLGNVVPTVHGEAHAYFRIFGFFGLGRQLHGRQGVQHGPHQDLGLFVAQAPHQQRILALQQLT